MKMRMPGDKSKVACEKCQALQQGTWNYGTFRLKDGRDVDDVMILSCDTCSAPCGTATQSGWRIQEAIDSPKRKRTTVRVSLPLLDFAATKASEVGGEPKRGPELLAQAVFQSLSRHPKTLPTFAKRLQSLQSPLLRGASRRMNLSLSPTQSRILVSLQSETNLSQSEVIRRALVASRSDSNVARELEVMFGAIPPTEEG